MRAPDQVRLWLGLMEEYDKEIRNLNIEQQDHATATGTGSIAAQDVDEEIVSESVRNIEINNKKEKLNKFRQQLIVDSEPYKTSRAASATLAMAAADVQVIRALIVENVAETYVKLLNSKLSELIHRVLVSITDACTVELQFDEQEYHEYVKQQREQEQRSVSSSSSTDSSQTTDMIKVKAGDIAITQHFIDHSLLPVIAAVINSKDPTLGE